MKPKVQKTEDEWREQLTPEQFRVCRQRGTETPYTGDCSLPASEGTYRCVCCGSELFKTGAKFVSGTGWPSFWEPVSEDAIETVTDRSHGMKRTEVKCAVCDAHLGHVFEDGPPPSGLRYCINSVCIEKE